MKLNFKEVLFWIFLVISIVLVLWSIFGNSPSDILVSSAVIVMIVMKVWGMNDKLIKLEIKTQNSFNYIKGDLNLIKENLGV